MFNTPLLKRLGRLAAGLALTACASLALAANPQVEIQTNQGRIVLELYADKAPKTVENFITLAKQGYYDGVTFHRVIPECMIQGGDPLSREDDARFWGTGGPDYRFNDEFNSHKLVLGSLAMANSGPNTNGSQFFIVTTEETPWLDGVHTNFGYVTKGMEVVKAIENTETGSRDLPIKDITIKSIELVK